MLSVQPVERRQGSAIGQRGGMLLTNVVLARLGDGGRAGKIGPAPIRSCRHTLYAVCARKVSCMQEHTALGMLASSDSPFPQ